MTRTGEKLRGAYRKGRGAPVAVKVIPGRRSKTWLAFESAMLIFSLAYLAAATALDEQIIVIVFGIMTVFWSAMVCAEFAHMIARMRQRGQ